MLIISNPNAGDKNGPSFLEAVALPLLKRHRASSSALEVKETNGPGEAGYIAVKYLQKFTGDMPVLGISGGDTTLHEVVNELVKHSVKQDAGIILIPSGTANALFHSLFPPNSRESFIRQLPTNLQKDLEMLEEASRHKLYSLLFFIANGSPRPLYSTRTAILSRQGNVVKQVVSSVVVSSSLHANILDVAESLRPTHPGIERFKIAAGQCITQWSNARVIVNHSYEVYDPSSQSFKQAGDSNNAVEFEGPFAYFLTTTNVDRLEEKFRIAPLATSIPATTEDGWMELLMIRPWRDPSVKEPGSQREDREICQLFASKTMNVLQAAYQDGAHVSLAYGPSGDVVNGIDKQDQAVVEYLRVKEWEWVPVGESVQAHLICVDGEVFKIPPGGRAKAHLLSGDEKVKLRVYGGI